MGYEFDNGTQQISYGSHIELYQSQDLSLGFWIKFLAGVSDGFQIIAQEDSFPIIKAEVRTLTGGNGLGVHFFHVLGGSFTFGPDCVPGAINPAYSLGVNQWLYFGVSRSYSARLYETFFGSRSAMIDGQTYNWPIGANPLPFGTPGQGLGPWVVGHQINGAIIGPAHYWDVPLTREQHLSMARCTLPTGVLESDLLWWTKMFEGAADVSSNMWANTFSGTPLPTYVPDEGCASFGNAQDYRLYNT